MPVPVRLDFTPPAQPDVVALRIYESAAEDGPWEQIERVADVGVYPTYISYYTTQLATSAVDWFSIAWEFAGGVVGPRSPAAKGGLGESLIAKVVERVMQRDRNLDEAVVTQEAEGVIESYFSGADPYDATLTTTFRKLNGLVKLVLARSLIDKQLRSVTGQTADSFTIGLVTARSSSGTNTQQVATAAIKDLLDQAMADLDIPQSVILQLAAPSWSNGLTSYDHSRLIGYIGLD